MFESADYCRIRKQLESEAFVLVSRFAAETSRLCGLIGQHSEWTESHRECRKTRDELTDCKAKLRAHRADHRC